MATTARWPPRAASCGVVCARPGATPPCSRARRPLRRALLRPRSHRRTAFPAAPRTRSPRRSPPSSPRARSATPTGRWPAAPTSSGPRRCWRRAELHVVLPFARDEFVARRSRRRPGWVERFHRCMEAATDVGTPPTTPLGDDVLFRYGAELAMGLALLRARYLDAQVRQLAVWDGRPAAARRGTAIDVATWRRPGGDVTSIPPPAAGGGRRPAPSRRPAASCARCCSPTSRASRKLTDEQLARSPARAGRVRRGPRPGGAGSLPQHVGRRPVRGARRRRRRGQCALDLQAAMAAIDLAAAGCRRTLRCGSARTSGPVFRCSTRCSGASRFIGSHVSRTARIEPVTPPGAIYVTERVRRRARPRWPRGAARATTSAICPPLRTSGGCGCTG